jgi:hypothetical protein
MFAPMPPVFPVDAFQKFRYQREKGEDPMFLDDQPRTVFGINREKLRRKSQFRTAISLGGGLAILLAIWSSALTAAEKKTYDLNPISAVGQMQQIQSVVEVQGDLKLDSDGTKVTRVPLLVNAQLRYDEKLLEIKSSPWSRRAVRYYHQAEASIKVGEGTLAPALNDGRRIVAAQVDKEGSVLHSPAGPLTRDELDLIESQGNSLLWWCLLPKGPVAIGNRWEVDQEPLGLLLGIDAVTQCSSRCSLASVDGDVALVDLSGSISGAVSGVATEIQLKAKYNFDLAQHRMTWFAASFKESRSISHAEPGFEVTTRVRASAARLQQSPALDESSLAGLSLEANAGTNLLAFQAEKSHFSLIHDRRWHSILDRPNLCVLRMVDRGTLIAQCNISELSDLEPGKKFTREAFQADVERSLGKNFGQFVEANQSASEEGKLIYRVVVSGATGEIPIQWIYYHIANDKGRRAALAFTLEAKLLERFAEADRTLAETFQFTKRPEPKPVEPREAEKNQPKPTRS